jgi:hypothetical protein
MSRLLESASKEQEWGVPPILTASMSFPTQDLRINPEKTFKGRVKQDAKHEYCS